MASHAWARSRGSAAGRLYRGWHGPPRRLVGLLAALLATALGLVLLLRPATPAYGAPLAPDFTLPVVSGGHGMLSLRQLRGHPVLLNFFWTGCEPCQAERPMLRTAFDIYSKKGVVVLGVAEASDNVATVRRFAAAGHLNYPMVLDSQGGTFWRYNVGHYPISLFIDARGYIRGEFDTVLTAEALRDGLAQAGALRCGNCATIVRPTSAPSNASGSDVFAPPYVAHPFTLRDQRGAIVSLASLRGKAVALTFLSSVCTEQCPLAGRALAQVDHLLGKDASRFSIVVVSADPENDAPATTLSFALKSGWRRLDWHYLTAPRPVLQQVWHAYGVPIEVPAPIFKGGVGLTHDASVYLLDAQGRWRAYIEAPFQAPQVASTVRALLHSQVLRPMAPQS